MMRYLFWSAAALLLVIGNGDSARILALFPFPGKSHFISFAPLLEELAKRGHEMTVVSAFPRKTPLKNYKDVVYPDFLHANSTDVNVFEMKDANILIQFTVYRALSVQFCDTFLKEPSVQDIIHKTDQQYDLIIYEPFMSECTYGLIYKFNVPYIHISSNSINKWMGEGVGNPHTYSYIPDMILGFSHHMSFKERMINTLTQSFLEFERNWITLPRMENVIRQHFNDPTIPSILDIENNSSFLLLNSHVSLNYPRPLTPNTAEVGGMHLRDAQKLPKDLQKLLDGATDGVIYFSLGTNVKSKHMPETMRNDILKSFSKLKQLVLWKWEADPLPEHTKNVHMSKWFPQSDILGHPNVRAFITHCGLLSTQEAAYFGVPIIGIPLLADQKQNSIRAADRGFAVVVDVNNITEKSLDWALHEITTNNRYRENAKQLSNLLKDQPQKPLERAVYWVEYVIRHKGAQHMRSAALKLNFFQYYLLDVIAVILVVVFISARLFVTICKLCLSYCRSSKSTRTKKTKEH